MSAISMTAPPRPRRRLPVGRILTYVLLVGFSAVFILPIYMMVVNGLKSATEVSVATMWRLPSALSSGGFAEAWAKLSPSFVNSLIVSVTATVASCLIGSITSYVLVLWGFRGCRLVTALIVFGMFIPYQSVLIPLVLFTQRIGLYGTLTGLIVVHVIYGQAVNTLIFGNYYRSVPKSLIEAARVDAAGVMKIYWRIILPLSPPAFVVAAIFQFTNIWNDFLFGVTIVPNPASQPVTVALNNLSGSYSVDWNVVMAGAVIAATPTALLYILLGRFFMRGLVSGSVKA